MSVHKIPLFEEEFVSQALMMLVLPNLNALLQSTTGRP